MCATGDAGWWVAHWTGTVTLRRDHPRIDTDPDALFRHSVQAASLLPLVGSALARDDSAAGPAKVRFWWMPSFDHRTLRAASSLNRQFAAATIKAL